MWQEEGPAPEPRQCRQSKTAAGVPETLNGQLAFSTPTPAAGVGGSPTPGGSAIPHPAQTLWGGRTGLKNSQPRMASLFLKNIYSLGKIVLESEGKTSKTEKRHMPWASKLRFREHVCDVSAEGAPERKQEPPVSGLSVRVCG